MDTQFPSPLAIFIFCILPKVFYVRAMKSHIYWKKYLYQCLVLSVIPYWSSILVFIDFLYSVDHSLKSFIIFNIVMKIKVLLHWWGNWTLCICHSSLLLIFIPNHKVGSLPLLLSLDCILPAKWTFGGHFLRIVKLMETWWFGYGYISILWFLLLKFISFKMRCDMDFP